MVRITCFFLIIVPLLVGGFSINNPNLMFSFERQPGLNSFHAAVHRRLIQEHDYPELKNDAEGSFNDPAHGLDGDLLGDFNVVNGILCRKCEPGFGLVSMCNSTHPTVCEPCASGVNYSLSTVHFRPCTPCSQCGANMYVEVECTAERDTFCDWCHSLTDRDSEEARMTVNNEDFWLKCQGTWTEKPAINKKDDWVLLLEQPPALDDDPTQMSNDNSRSAEKPSLLTVEEIKRLNTEIDQELNLDGQLEQEEVSAPAADFTFVQVPPPKPDEKNDVDSDFAGSDEAITVFIINPITRGTNEGQSLQKTSVASLTESTNNPYSDIVFKPSVHEYPYNELVHASSESVFSQVRMVVIMHRFWIAAFAALLTFLLVILIVLKCRKRKDAKFMVATLTDDDNKIIEECAQKMESCEKVMQAKQYRLRRLNPFNVNIESDHDDDDDRVDDQNVEPVHVTENPLMQYLEQDILKKEASKNTSEPVNV